MKAIEKQIESFADKKIDASFGTSGASTKAPDTPNNSSMPPARIPASPSPSHSKSSPSAPVSPMQRSQAGVTRVPSMNAEQLRNQAPSVDPHGGRNDLEMVPNIDKTFSSDAIGNIPNASSGEEMLSSSGVDSII